MSRIGKLPISIPAGVTVTLKDDVVTVKGPKGEMSQYVNPAINVTIEDGHVVLLRCTAYGIPVSRVFRSTEQPFPAP